MNKFYTLLLTFFITLFFTACGDSNRQDPYIMGHSKSTGSAKVYTTSSKPKSNEVTIATIEAESKKEIAQINKERDLELKQIEEKTKLLELKTKNEMAIKEHNLSTYVQESSFAFKNSTLFVISFGVIAFLSLLFYIFKKRREDKLKMHEDELQKEMYIREKELQVKMAEKILDTIASGKLSEEREQHLLEALDKTTSPTLLSK